MIPDKSSNAVVMSGEFKTKQFGIDSEDFSHLVDLIQNQLYSDKPLALIREYSCNAYDANAIVGKKNVPIKVTLPSLFAPQLKIRDYGAGLTLEQMEGIFTRYGKSTKRGDNVQVGCFGIGSKAGFAYGQSFMVIAYTDGVKTTYNCVLDETNVGKLIVLGNDVTDEDNGLEVVINVRKDDIDNFRKIAMNFYRYWDVMPNIEGFSDEDYKNIRGNDVISLSGNGWAILNENKHSWDRRQNGTVAVMGNIGYPIQWNSIKGLTEYFEANNDRYGFEYFITDNQFRFDFNIGEVKMSPSRESLQYTELTNNAIIQRIKLMVSELSDQVQAKINTASNLWEAKVMYDQLFNMSGCLHRLRKQFNLTYNGKPLANNNIGPFDNYNCLKTYMRRNNKHNFNNGSDAYSHIECLPMRMILEIDQEDKVYIQKAIKYLSAGNKVSTIYVLKFADAAQRKQVFDATGLDDSFITKYSSISDDVKNSIVRTVGQRGNYNYTVGSTKDSNLRSLKYISSNMLANYGYSDFSNLPKEEYDITQGGYYVELDHSSMKGIDYTTIVNFLNGMYKHDKTDITVHFIGQSVLNTKAMKNANWVKLTDYINEKANKVLTDVPSVKMFVAIRDCLMAETDNSVYRMDPYFAKYIVNINDKLDIVADLNNAYKYEHLYDIVRNVYKCSYDIRNEVVNLYNFVDKTFPLLRMFNNSWHDNRGFGELMLSYLKEKAEKAVDN